MITNKPIQRQKKKKKVFEFVMYTVMKSDFFSNSKNRTLKKVKFETKLTNSLISELHRDGLIQCFGNGYLAKQSAFEKYQRITANYMKNPLTADHITKRLRAGVDALIDCVFKLSTRNKIYKLGLEQRTIELRKIFLDTAKIKTKKLHIEVFKRVDQAILSAHYENKKELFIVLSAFFCPFVCTYIEDGKRKTYIESDFIQMNEKMLTKGQAAELLNITVYAFNKMNIQAEIDDNRNKLYSLLSIKRLKNKLHKNANK